MSVIKEADKSRKTNRIQMWLIFLIGAALALALIFPLRGIMNAVSRLDYISQRLDDYPHMKTVYLQETREWSNWWQKEVSGYRAGQAAYIFAADEKHQSEEEKLSYIAGILNAEKAQIIPEAEYQSIAGAASEETPGRSFAKLSDGRVIMLEFADSSESERLKKEEEDTLFLSQVEAGLPGYICVYRDGSLSVYPEDENAGELKAMIGSMIESGKPDPAALAREAQAEGKTVLKIMLNPKSGSLPARQYLLYCAAYADNDDFVINVAETGELFRFGRKRSWSLWYLFCAIMLLMGRTLWRTRLHKAGTAPEEEFPAALRSGISALFMATLLILASVLVVQMLSGVNLAQQGATDQAEYLKMVLARESKRATMIEKKFDDLYQSRAEAAARVLTDNPQLVDADSLHGLDRSLDGAGLRVFNSEGGLVASDEMLHSAENTSMINYSAWSQQLMKGEAANQMQESAEETPRRYYRAVMVSDDGKTVGWVELMAEQKQLDELLRDTGLQEVIGDLHILDTLHAVAVENAPEGRLSASTSKDWVGDLAEDHGIHPEQLYDGYEGIVNFDGSKCYSVVFDYNDHHVIVGSENETALVFIGGVIFLTWLLAVVLMLAVYRPLVRLILGYQKQVFAEDPEGEIYAAKSRYPVLQDYLRDFMIAVFFLSMVLFFTTEGDPAGLTYNIVRGTWVRGVNAATITTSIMLASVVFAIQKLIDTIVLRLGKYMSPKGVTICRLIDSGFTYIGTIIIIIYALSMFGVNTATLIGGVGATALIFTLGANSLIADVLAGIFIIFEGDFTVGDVVVIDDFRGIVTDIGMRTTKLMDDNTRDIKIISNSSIRELTNQSRENSAVIIDIPISRSIDVEKSEEILREAIQKLPEQYPKIIGTPQYWGVSKLPEKSPYTGKLGGYKARIAFDCDENDREMLTYKIYRALVSLVAELNNSQSTAPAATAAASVPADAPAPAPASNTAADAGEAKK